MYLAIPFLFALGALAGPVIQERDALCPLVTKAVSIFNDASQASQFCSSYLKISTRTSTVQPTVTSVSYTSTIPLDARCPAPPSQATVARRAGTVPAAFASFASTLLSSACSCLSIPTPKPVMVTAAVVSTITVTITSTVPVTFAMYGIYYSDTPLYATFTGADSIRTPYCVAQLLSVDTATTAYPRNAIPQYYCPPLTCPTSWNPPVSYTFAPGGVPVYANDKSAAFWQATPASVPESLTQILGNGLGNIFFAPTLAVGAAPVRCCVDAINHMSCSWTNPATPTYTASVINARNNDNSQLQITTGYLRSPYSTISFVPLQTGSSACYTNN